MLTKISTTVATVAIAAATTSAYVAEALDKRDAVVDQDNSLADVAILSHVNKIVKPSLRVDDHDGDASLLVNHVKQQEVDEKPLKNHWRRRTKMLGKDGSSRNSLDLGILGKNQEQKHHRVLGDKHGRHLQAYGYGSQNCYYDQFTLVTSTSQWFGPGGFSGEICLLDTTGTESFCFSISPNGSIGFSFLSGDDCNYDEYSGTFSVSLGSNYPCGVPGGIYFSITSFCGVVAASGTLLEPNYDCSNSNSAEVSFLKGESCDEATSVPSNVPTDMPSDVPTDMPSDMPSSKSSKSKSKKSKSKKSKSPSSAPSIFVDYTTY